MPQEEPQSQLPDGPPKTVERNPFRNPEYLRGLALAAPRATNPFLVSTPAAEAAQRNAPAAATSRLCEASDNRGNYQQEYAPVVNIEHVGIAFSGINFGHVTQIDEFNVLRNLPVHPDISGHLSEYFPDSRTNDEASILQWIDSRHPPELVLCVLGKVGVGKSTLAKHLATRLEKDKRLAANIFLGFALPDWSAESVVRMAAGQLCGAFPTLTRAVCEAIRLDVNPSVPLETRIVKLVLEPIRSLGLPHPLVILLDALDQWVPHPILIKALTRLTTGTHLVRFVVLGRPGLEDRFQNVSFRRYDLPDVVESIMGKYFRERFNQVRWEYGRKPSAQTINQLADKANGLFIWSSTLCSILEDELSCPNPHETVTAILQLQQSVDDNDVLAKLYHDAINLRFPKPDHKAKLKMFLGAALVLQEPLPIAAFASTVSMAAPTIRKILADLRPLQTGQMKDDQDMVHPASMRFHLSFQEYLQSIDTPPHLASPVDIFMSHSQLGKSCLEELRRLLSSPQSTSITPLQKYAARYWPTHVAYGTPSVTPTSDVEWKATPHSAILEGLSVPQWQFWASTYLQLVRPGTSLDLSEPAPEPSVRAIDDLSQSLISLVLLPFLGTPMAAGIPDAIPVAEVAVRLQHRSSDAWLQLAIAYNHVSRTNASVTLLDSAVCACRYAADIAGRGEHKILTVLATCLREHFLRSGVSENLAEAIMLDRAAVLATPPSDPKYPFRLNNRAVSLHSDYGLTGSAKSLDEAILLYREALLLWPSGHPRRAVALNNLANSLRSRFKLAGTAEDLDEVIALLQEALLLSPPGHPYRKQFLDSLASAVHSRFKMIGTAENLDEAILLCQEALSLRPLGHPDRALALQNLANSLQSRFNLIGGAENLEEVIVLLREALSLRRPGHPERAVSLNNLANSLQSLFELTGAVENLDEAIVLLEEALSLWTTGHPDRANSLDNLANAFYFRFKMTGATERLDQAISLYQEALLLRPLGRPDRSTSLNNLANSLQSLFELTGAVKNLDEAIVLFEEALSLLPYGHPERSPPLNSLANALRFRFKVTGTTEALDKAIVHHREALLLRAPGHPERALSLTNLATSLQSRFELTDDTATLEEAIMLSEEALSLWPSGHPSHAFALNNLAVSLESHSKLTKDVATLDEAIILNRQSLALQPSGHPDRALSLNNLAYTLRSHFNLTGNAESLNESITLWQDVLSLWPPGHRNHSTILTNIASNLEASSTLACSVQSRVEARSLTHPATETT